VSFCEKKKESKHLRLVSIAQRRFAIEIVATTSQTRSVNQYVQGEIPIERCLVESVTNE